jgi:hypothetical protein
VADEYDELRTIQGDLDGQSFSGKYRIMTEIGTVYRDANMENAGYGQGLP